MNAMQMTNKLISKTQLSTESTFVTTTTTIMITTITIAQQEQYLL